MATRDWGMAAAAALTVGAAAPAPERVVSGDRIIAATVNGVPVKLRVDPGAPGLPLLTAEAVARLGLKGGGMLGFGVRYLIGKEAISGQTAVARVGLNKGAPERKRIGWTTRRYPLAADGTVGAGGLPEAVVRFALRPARAGEHVTALPMTGAGGLFGGWNTLRAVIEVGGTAIPVRFDPSHRHSLATAGAGVVIAAAQGGVLTDERDRQEISFGVERPIRFMTLARPLAIGPVSLARLGVRVTDGAGANTIAEEGADPSEVVVTGKGRKSAAILSLGADVLDRCSSITFDKLARQIRLSCG